MCRRIGVLVTRRLVIDLLVWYGEAMATVLGGRGEHLLPRKIHSEDDIKVTGARGGRHCLYGNIFIYLDEP